MNVAVFCDAAFPQARVPPKARHGIRRESPCWLGLSCPALNLRACEEATAMTPSEAEHLAIFWAWGWICERLGDGNHVIVSDCKTVVESTRAVPVVWHTSNGQGAHLGLIEAHQAAHDRVNGAGQTWTARTRCRLVEWPTRLPFVLAPTLICPSWRTVSRLPG